jgi:hypothetical protein
MAMKPYPTPSETLPDQTPEGIPIPTFTPWRPQRERAGGWSAETQRGFIAELTRTGLVGAAARAVGKSARSAYQLREKPGAESFAAAWDAAKLRAGQSSYAVAVHRAIHGDIIPQFRGGRFTGFKIQQNDRMLIAAIKAMGASDAELEERRQTLERWEVQLRRMQIGLQEGDKTAEELAEAEEDHRVWERELKREQRRQRNAEIRDSVRKGLAKKGPPEPRVRFL